MLFRSANIKRGLKFAAQKAGLGGQMGTHLLRHSAAVHLAESGIPMEEIAQYLGHDEVEVTRRVYARFSPTYLRKAAAALEYELSGSMNQRSLSKNQIILLDNMVGATGIEPVTPTMSTERAVRKLRK